MVVFFLLILSVRHYANQPNILKDIREGIFHPDVMVELEGTTVEIIDDMTFKFEVFGFDEPVIVVLDKLLSISLPTSDLHSAIIWGRFDSEGIFHLIDYRVSYFQVIKYITSFIGFVWFLFLFFNEWKLTWKGFEEKRKNA